MKVLPPKAMEKHLIDSYQHSLPHIHVSKVSALVLAKQHVLLVQKTVLPYLSDDILVYGETYLRATEYWEFVLNEIESNED